MRTEFSACSYCSYKRCVQEVKLCVVWCINPMPTYLHMTMVCLLGQLLRALLSRSMRLRMAVGWGSSPGGQLLSCSRVTSLELGDFPSTSVTTSLLSVMSPWILRLLRVTLSFPYTSS